MLVNIYEAKTHLSALLERVQSGEEIVIAKAGQPVARLTPIHSSAGTRSGVRLGGLKTSQLKLAPDFYAPMTDDDLLRS